MINILVVDDHAVVRAGVTQIISRVPDMRVIAEAGTGAEALERIRTARVDVVVLDISLPDRGGLDVLQEIRANWRFLPVLMLSMFAEGQYAVPFLKAGAAGYVAKESAPEQLIDAIRHVSSGKQYVPPGVARALASTEEAPPHERLSRRELQVAVMIADGLKPTEIATQLGISIKTVSTHRTRAMEKLGARSTAEMIHYAIDHHLIVPPRAKQQTM